jgi:hypothetical protein
MAMVVKFFVKLMQGLFATKKKIKMPYKHTTGINLSIDKIEFISLNGDYFSEEDRRLVIKSLLNHKVFSFFGKVNHLQIEYRNSIQAGSSVVDAQGVHVKQSFHKAEKLYGLPYLDKNSICLEETCLVRVINIEKFTPGMGSWWGFDGYVIGILLILNKSKIIDARAYHAS